jgi:LPS sulfotransferase NodH
VRRPTSCYLIGANQRSGTHLLCQALADTGLAGRPDEFFLSVDEAAMPDFGTWEDGPFGVALRATDRADYLDRVFDAATTPNGVFGVKVMANNLPWAFAKLREVPRLAGLSEADLLHELLPGLRVVNVVRGDHVAQAVSWARASMDGVWRVDDATSPEPTAEASYDGELITNLIRLIEEGEQAWQALYVELGLTPHQVVYEDLVSEEGWEPTIRGVLDHLGLDLGDAPVPPPRVHRQADDLNAAWIERFRAVT